MPRLSPKIFAQELRWIFEIETLEPWYRKSMEDSTIFVIDPPKALFMSTNNKEFGHRIAEEWC